MKLFAWQQRAAVDAAGKSGWGLFAAPGTGKTLAALNIARQENLVPVVVSPKAVKPQWLDAGVWHAYHYEQLFNRDNCRLVARQLREGRCCFIVDEGHRIANPNTLTTRNIIQLGQLATKRLDLTGTPTANSPADFYAQMKFLRPDVKLESRREFQERYLVPNKGLASRIRGNPFIPLRNHDGTLRLRNMDEFLDRISRYGTFLHDDEVQELPERTFAVRECTPDAALMKAYKELHEHYATEVGTTTLTATNAAVLATRLLRLASGLGAAEESAPLFTNPKIGQLMADLEQFVVERKVICWSVWTAERDQLRHELGKARVPFTSDAEKFKTDSSIKVLVASPKQHGAGLNLQAATYQLWLSRTWSLIEREQGLRRNYRVGQTERTHVIDYVTAGTIDKRALNILENKADLLDFIIKGKL